MFELKLPDPDPKGPDGEARRVAVRRASMALLLLLARLRERNRRDLALDSLERAAQVILVTCNNWFFPARRPPTRRWRRWSGLKSMHRLSIPAPAKAPMHTATIDCLLDYEVASPTHFCFNIEAAFHESHRVLEERLSVTPSVKVRHFCDERRGNRFFRLDAPAVWRTLGY